MKKKVFNCVLVVMILYVMFSCIVSCLVSIRVWDLDKRFGLTVVEFVPTTVLNYGSPNTKDRLWGMSWNGSKIAYDKEKYNPGDKVYSFFVYNPFTNYSDDIIARFDFLQKGV